MRFKSTIKYLVAIICAIVGYECVRYICSYVKLNQIALDSNTARPKTNNLPIVQNNIESVMARIDDLYEKLENTKRSSPESTLVNPDLVAYSDGIADMIAGVMDATVSIATMEDDELSMKNISEIVNHHYLKGIVTRDFMYGFLNSDRKKVSTIQGSLGSGFITKIEKGVAYVVTNYHVVAGAKNITIFLNDKTAIPAEMHGFDEMIDLAVVKFNISHAGRSKVRIAPLRWGDSSRMREGNVVFAIGNPFGLGGTVTNGIISSMKRNIHDDLVLEDNYQRDIYIQSSNFIQHNASINVGSSGGCLINSSGEVIGVNRNIIPGSDEDGGNIGIALAIPSNIASAIVEKIIRKSGEMNRGWIGVVTQFIGAKEFAALYGNTIEQNMNNFGFFVSSVLNGSSAQKSGIRQYDIIIALNGKRVTSNMDLMNFVSMANIGEMAELTILRQDGAKLNTIKISTTVNDIHSYEVTNDQSRHSSDDRKIGANIKAVDIVDVGISVKDLPRFVTDNRKFRNNAKVVVIYADVINAPYSTSFEVGDGVVMADGKNIQNAYQLKMVVDQAKNEGRKYISFVVQRGRTYQMIAKTINSGGVAHRPIVRAHQANSGVANNQQRQNVNNNAYNGNMSRPANNQSGNNVQNRRLPEANNIARRVDGVTNNRDVQGRSNVIDNTRPRNDVMANNRQINNIRRDGSNMGGTASQSNQRRQVG